MTIKEAWEKWSSRPEVAPFASKNRLAFMTVFKAFLDKDISDFDTDLCRKILDESIATREYKVKAASTLIKLLWFGFDHNLCKAVQFELIDVLPPEKLSELETIKKIHARAIGKKGGRPGEKVCKIDPTTFEVVDTYDSIAEAQRQNDGVFLDRALSKGYKANGFYWSRKPLVDSFIEQLKLKSFGLKPKKADPEERKKRSDQIKAERETAVKAGREAFNNAINETVARVLEKATDEELLAELQRRGWHGPIQLTKKIVL